MAYVWLNDVVKQAEILFFVKMAKPGTVCFNLGKTTTVLSQLQSGRCF
jgi:hypothetical protein